MHHRHQRRGAFVARLRVEGLGPAQRVRGAPRHAVEPRHLADHEVHQADLGRARHRRAGLHRHGRQVMAVDRGAALAHHLGVGQRRQRLGVQLRHGRRHRGGRVGAAQHEGRAQHRLVAAAEGAHRAQHGLVPDQRRVAVAVAGGDRVSSMNASPNRIAHISITSSAFFGLVVMPMKVLSEVFHRRIGDAQVPVADRVVQGSTM
jgi:hypothetical protein